LTDDKTTATMWVTKEEEPNQGTKSVKETGLRSYLSSSSGASRKQVD